MSYFFNDVQNVFEISNIKGRIFDKKLNDDEIMKDEIPQNNFEFLSKKI